jgi:hypothetical protein|tara:strand:+ start:2291 stop:2851 length:561 start_codon:yes stop_codon:yes gene_type:complete
MAESPVDINKLASVLNKSKALLDTVDRQFGSSSNISEGRPPLSENTVDSSQLLSSLPQGQTQKTTTDPTKAIQHTLKNANTTKMPKEIVEAMINNPLLPPSEKPSGDLDPELIKMINPGYKESKKPSDNIKTESFVSSTKSTDLKSLIREVVEEVIVERKVDEQIQIRVGDTIFTGRITKSKSIKK